MKQYIKKKLKNEDLQIFDQLAAIVKRTQPNADQSRNAPVLKNLTAKQWVQNGIITESDYAYSLGEVVAVLTVWTGDGSGTRRLENGIWASHCLDIATMADVSDGEWTDVSDTAVELLMEGTG